MIELKPVQYLLWFGEQQQQEVYTQVQGKYVGNQQCQLSETKDKVKRNKNVDIKRDT
jgi:hypothetical protein